jgi:hypothetical protein
VSLTSDIKSLLTFITPNIFRMDAPADPDNLICLYPSGGFAPVMNFEGRTYEQPSFLVRIRHKDADTAVLWAEQVKDTLTPIHDLTIDSTRYIDITQTSDIMPLGRDSRGRMELTINFNAKIQR